MGGDLLKYVFKRDFAIDFRKALTLYVGKSVYLCGAFPAGSALPAVGEAARPGLKAT